MSSIAEKIGFIRENIIKARQDSPYAAANITIMAVTKTVKPPRMAEALTAGLDCFGENKVQELLDKYDSFPEVQWHFIGHLQTNKVKYIIDKVAMIHSLDRESLAQEIEKQAAKTGRVVPCLLEVNIAEEDTKFGLKEAETEAFLRALAAYPHIAVKGLMTIAPYVEDMEENRPVFRRLRQLRDELAALNLPYADMRELSMGMTGDYMVAASEGATFVRIGTGIFGMRA